MIPLRIPIALQSAVLTGALLLATALHGRPASARVIGRSAEISVGREAASMVEQFYTVDTDAAGTARVRAVGRRLVAAIGRSDYPFEFHLVEAPEVNAFALPGGFIYVFRGLVQLLPSEDALASVLAHEISHVTQRHSVRQFEKSILLSAGLAAVLLGTRASGFDDAAGLVQALASLTFTRRDETDADRHGIALLARAGYDPRAAAEAMRVIERTGDGERHEPAFLRTHPAPRDRIRLLTQLAEEIRAAPEGRPASLPGAPAGPAPPVGRIEGLDGFRPEPCPWLPLAPGACWTYAVRGSGSESTLRVSVVERVEAEPEGVWRVRYEMDRRVRSTRLVAASPGRILSRAEGPGASPEWKEEAAFGGPASEETVAVPAGAFPALRIEQSGETSWYARGVGLVKRLSPGGVVVELKSFDPGRPVSAPPEPPAPR